jgi:hypothetical protein
VAGLPCASGPRGRGTSHWHCEFDPTTGRCASRTPRGARAVATQALVFAQRAPSARPALVNGTAGLVADTGGRLLAVMGFTVCGAKIMEIDILADPARLRRFDLPVPNT